MGDIFLRLQGIVRDMSSEDVKPLSKMGRLGMTWARSGGEASGIYHERFLAADGIENVISVLNALEDKTLSRVDFIELNACPGGCVGGVLCLENPFIAKARIQALNKFLPDHLNTLAAEGKPLSFYQWTQMPDKNDAFALGADRMDVMQKMIAIKKLCDTLPQADCGLCGAPSCRAFSEDKINGIVPEDAQCLRMDEVKKENGDETH